MNPLHPTWKQKVKHELVETAIIFLYLSFFLCAFVTYDVFLLKRYEHVEFWDYVFAIVNAMALTKVVMVGEYIKLGKRLKRQSLFLFAIWKAFVFCLLVFAFHVLEEVIKRLIHGGGVANALRDIRLDQLGSRAIVIFCVFITLFAFREIRRVIGEEEFWSLVFGEDKTLRRGP